MEPARNTIENEIAEQIATRGRFIAADVGEFIATAYGKDPPATVISGLVTALAAFICAGAKEGTESLLVLQCSRMLQGIVRTMLEETNAQSK